MELMVEKDIYVEYSVDTAELSSGLVFLFMLQYRNWHSQFWASAFVPSLSPDLKLHWIYKRLIDNSKLQISILQLLGHCFSKPLLEFSLSHFLWRYLNTWLIFYCCLCDILYFEVSFPSHHVFVLMFLFFWAKTYLYLSVVFFRRDSAKFGKNPWKYFEFLLALNRPDY